MKFKYSLFWFFVIILLIITTLNIFIPSIQSIQSVCFPEIAKEKGINILATTKEITNESGEKEIIVTYFVKPSLKTIKHEQCHVEQSHRKITFSSSCSNLIGKFMRENECYLAEKLPNKIYENFYGTIEIPS